MGRVVVLPAVVMVVASLTGCGTSARYVDKRGDTGIVAIPENTDMWPTHYRRSALELIQQHVGPDYVIVEERRVVTGVSSTNNQQIQRDKMAGPFPNQPPVERDTVSNSTTNRDITEYQITYQRRKPGMPVPGLVPAGGIPPAGGLQQTGGPIPSVLPVGGPTVLPAAWNTPPAGQSSLPTGSQPSFQVGGSMYR